LHSVFGYTKGASDSAAKASGGFSGCGKRPGFDSDARNTFLRAFYETAGFVKVFVFAFVFSLVAFCFCLFSIGAFISGFYPHSA
jgi:hypothetical protein